MPSTKVERAGARDVLVTLQAPSETVSGGNASIPYPTQGTAWMRMEGLSGTNRAGLTAEAGYRFTTDYRSDITPRWQLAFGSPLRTFQIVSAVDPDGLHRDLTIFAQEILA